MEPEVFYPESLQEYVARLEKGEKDPYAIIKDLRFPPGDPRRYGQADSAPDVT